MSTRQDLLTQTEARVEARETNSRMKADAQAAGVPLRVVAVAHTVPLGCWGGAEKGWTVSYVPVQP